MLARMAEARGSGLWDTLSSAATKFGPKVFDLAVQHVDKIPLPGGLKLPGATWDVARMGLRTAGTAASSAWSNRYPPAPKR